jgi:hypothetical protein
MRFYLLSEKIILLVTCMHVTSITHREVKSIGSLDFFVGKMLEVKINRLFDDVLPGAAKLGG